MIVKFGKTIEILRLSQNYLVLIKIKSVSDKHAQTSNVICKMAFNLSVGGCK